VDKQNFHRSRLLVLALSPLVLSPVPTGPHWQTSHPAYGFTQVDDHKKELQTATQPERLVVKSCTTQDPQDGTIQAHWRVRGKKQVQEGRLVEALDQSEEWCHPAARPGCIGGEMRGTKVLLAKGLQDRIGSLEVGKRCELAFWSIQDYQEIGYHFGVNLVRSVIRL